LDSEESEYKLAHALKKNLAVLVAYP